MATTERRVGAAQGNFDDKRAWTFLEHSFLVLVQLATKNDIHIYIYTYVYMHIRIYVHMYIRLL